MITPDYIIPLTIQRIVAIIAFGEAIFLISWYVRLVERTIQRMGTAQGDQSHAPVLVGAFLAMWFAVALVIGDGAHYPLANEALRRPISALPLILFFIPAVIWIFGSRAGRAINSATAPAALIGIQFYRIAGGFFLFPFLFYGTLPAEFAWPAGIGDMLTGFFAPFVAWMVARKRPGTLGWAVAWNCFGILDLIVAPATAIHSHALVLQMYPLALVPLFLGPPLGILTHLCSLRNLVVNRGSFEALTPEVRVRGPDMN
jgi:hypothetical protein